MQPIRVGIMGQGRSGRNIHGVYLKDDPRYRIVAVADPIAYRREWSAREYGCEAHADHRELLARKDLDLVINATFSHLHVPLTLEALEAGHHVLCEKPLARSAAEADRLIAASEKAGKVLAIFQQSRFASYFQQVRQVIASGVLGRIVQISIRFNGHSRRWDWQTLTEFNGGNLLNTGPHPLDQALALFGEGEPEVWCRMDRTEEGSVGDAENHVKLLLTGEGHPLIDLEISSCCGYSPFTYQVYGSRGGLRATQTEAQWRYFDPAAAPELVLRREPLADEKGDPIYPRETIEWIERKWPEEDESAETSDDKSYAPAQPGVNMSKAFYDMLHRTLATGAPLEITPQQVRRQMAVIAACRRQNPRIYPQG